MLGTLAYLVRADPDLLRVDNSVANWGHGHASPGSTDVLDAVTNLGEPMVVAALAAVLALVETVRTRSRWVVPFLLVVVAGNGILTTTIKHLADRVRPDAEPDRRDARAVVPQRPLVVVGRVLRGGGAPARSRSRPRRAGGDRRGCGRARPDGRRQSRAARACTG